MRSGRRCRCRCRASCWGAGCHVVSCAVASSVEAGPGSAAVVSPAGNRRTLQSTQTVIGIGRRFLRQRAAGQNGRGRDRRRQPDLRTTHGILPCPKWQRTLSNPTLQSLLHSKRMVIAARTNFSCVQLRPPQTARASAFFSRACADALIWHTRAAPTPSTCPISSRFSSST